MASPRAWVRTKRRSGTQRAHTHSDSGWPPSAPIPAYVGYTPLPTSSHIQAVRRGKPSKLVTAVTLSLTDADGYVAAINITDILMNKATAGWQCERQPGLPWAATLLCLRRAACATPLLTGTSTTTARTRVIARQGPQQSGQEITRPAPGCRGLTCIPQHADCRAHMLCPPSTGQCRPSRYDNCSCVPNAALLGGGRFSVIPQWRRATRPGPLADTTFQARGIGKDAGCMWSSAVQRACAHAPAPMLSRSQPPLTCSAISLRLGYPPAPATNRYSSTRQRHRGPALAALSSAAHGMCAPTSRRRLACLTTAPALRARRSSAYEHRRQSAARRFQLGKPTRATATSATVWLLRAHTLQVYPTSS